MTDAGPGVKSGHALPDLAALPPHVWIRLHDRNDVGRKLRISLVEHCNYACFFCHNEGQGPLGRSAAAPMPIGDVVKLAEVALHEGVTRIKLTGGEPLLYRSGKHSLVDLVRSLSELRSKWSFDLSLTTNGSLLSRHADRLRAAGLNRVTVSLTTSDQEVFSELIATNSRLLPESIRGIQAAEDAGLDPVKINMVLYHSALRNMGNLDEIKRVFDLAATLGVAELRLYTLLWHERFARFDEFYQFFSPAMCRSVAELLRSYASPAPAETTELLANLARAFADRLYPKVEFGVQLGPVRVGFEAMKYGRLSTIEGLQEGPYAMRVGSDGALRPTLNGPAKYDLIRGIRNGLPVATLRGLYRLAVEEMP